LVAPDATARGCQILKNSNEFGAKIAFINGTKDASSAVSAEIEAKRSLKNRWHRENEMAAWIAIIAYYSVYTVCFTAKAIHMRKRAHAEVGRGGVPHTPSFA
jgi:hypothetical protein